MVVYRQTNHIVLHKQFSHIAQPSTLAKDELEGELHNLTHRNESAILLEHAVCD